MIDLTSPHRQSPIAVVFLAVRVVRQIGIAQLAIIGVFLVTGSFAAIVVPATIVGLTALGAFAAAAWWRFTFEIAASELVVHRGVLQSERVAVPIERIQSVAIEQELLHRMVGLVKVSIDTAGSSEAELVLDAVERTVADELERLTVSATSSAPVAPGGDLPPPVVEHVLFQHDPHRLTVTALASSPLRGIAVLAPLLALWGLADDLGADAGVEVDGDDVRWWWPLALLVGFFVLSVALNVIRVMLRDWELAVRTTPTGLRRTAGLISRTSTAISTRRIQLVTSRRNPLERRVGLRTARLATIGQGNVVVQGADDGEHDTLRALSDVSLAPSLDRHTHRASIWLAVRNTTTAMLSASVAAWFVVGWWSALLLAIVPVTWLSAARRVATFRWSIDSELATTVAVVNCVTEQALLRRANGVTVTQSLFERRRGLAQLRLDTAAGSIAVGMIPVDEACAARDIILHAAEIDHRPWM